MHLSTLRRPLLLSALFILTLPLTAHAQAPVVEAQNDSGETLLQVNEDGGFVLFGEYDAGTGTIPVEGEGTRLMWYPEKAAFRAGHVTEFQSEAWDDDNVGIYSTAVGYTTTASGSASTAMGIGTEASGVYSTAMGAATTASGNRATAMGNSTVAATAHSLATGSYNVANQNEDGTLFVVGNGSSDLSRSDALVLDEDGELWVAGTLTEASDRRLKTEIEPMSEDVLDALSEIQAVRYRFRTGTGHPTNGQIGLIAQEVQQHFPELVREGADGYLSLSYSKLTAVLLKGLQEQRQENEALAARVEALDSEKEALEARVATLEQMMQDRSPVAAGPTGYAPLLASVLLLLGGAFVLHRRRSAT